MYFSTHAVQLVGHGIVVGSFPFFHFSRLCKVGLSLLTSSRRVGKRRFTTVPMEKGIQVMMITISLLTLFCTLTTVHLLLSTPDNSFCDLK